MPDMTMCFGQECPFKEKCYRYTAKPDKLYQSYFHEIPYEIEEGECDYLWEITTYKEPNEHI